MGDRERERHPSEAVKGLLPEKGPTTSQSTLAVATLLPLSGGLFALAGFTLVCSLVGLAVLTPLFLLFSPVLVPAGLLVLLTGTGFMASSAFGLAGVSSVGYLLKQARGVAQKTPEQIERVKRRVGEAAEQAKQKDREAGQAAQVRVEETKRS